MKELLLLLCTVFYCLFFLSQEIISNQGEYYLIANKSIVFTIGEVVIKTGTDGVFDLTQGFHQSHWNITAMEDHNSSFDATIFPNPTTEILKIKTTMFKGVNYSIYNAQGKLISSDKLYLEQTSINVSQLPVGSYLVNLNDANKNLKTYKLIKTR